MVDSPYRCSVLLGIFGVLALLGCATEPQTEAILPDLGPGVSRSLATHRARILSDLHYEITLSIPEEKSEAIAGRNVVRVDIADPTSPLAFDFAQPAKSVRSVQVAGEPIAFEVKDEHLLIGPDHLVAGSNEIAIDFIAGDGSLNRSDEFLYTLFVPDRARVALPIIDQPDLKARYRLTLEIPRHWQAVANGALESRSQENERSRWTFAETEPISTYLLAFSAGAFEVVERTRGERTLRMLHRETDNAKVERNLDAIFELHFDALDWLEDYTAIAYPFSKLDFAAIPAFQYGGMEHPGSIFYRDRSLFLDESATQNQYLGRASLIAHEVAHMWFGNLVTMEWFDDVWMKEVFANFMAAKVVNPSFPEIDHDLRFLLAHYPAAYRVDRTEGANPIRQELANLNEAGSLYGAIIYQKAPIAMKHLELLTGDEAFRDGLRTYLDEHRYGNATWSDLIRVLDQLTEEDLASWSRIWVEQADRPTIHAEVELDATAERIESIRVLQQDPRGSGRIWPQTLEVLLGSGPATAGTRKIHLRSASLELTDVAGLPAPSYLLVNGMGIGYGDFLLDTTTRDHLLEQLPPIEDSKVRAVAWLSLWDGLLGARVDPVAFLELALAALPNEDDELNTERILGYLGTTFWRYLSLDQRTELAPRVERALRRGIEEAQESTLKGSYFAAFRDTALTPTSIDYLRAIWSGEEVIDGLPLSENDTTRIAQQLALRGLGDAEAILDRQLEHITNPDNSARFEFVRPALSSEPEIRDEFFSSLAEPSNREREPWVLEALGLLHHPLRAERSERYITPSLDLLEEIQVTGDIFFPLGWLNATLGGHSSTTAADAVHDFLDRRSDLPKQLRGKLLQAADQLFRSAAIVSAAPADPS